MNQYNSQPSQLPIELVVIINSFNRLSLLREALPSITQALKVLPVKSAIVIFEAGSTDDSVEFIKKASTQNQETQIVLFCASADMDSSFSAGCNFAVQFAAQRFPDLKWCLFFETDNLIINQSALPLALNLLEQEEELAAVGFTVEGRDGGKRNCGCRFPTPLAYCLGRQLGRRLKLEQMPINQWYSFSGVRWGFSDVVYTSPCLIRYSAWQATGGMDSATFPFSDCDVDWFWTARKKGWRAAILDMPGVIHDNRAQKSEWSNNRGMKFHQARLILLRKHLGQWTGMLKPILFIRHCLELFLLALVGFYSERARKGIPQRQAMINTVFNGYET